MVFRSASYTLRNLLGKKESAPKPPKRSSTPRRDGDGKPKPSGFRIIVPDYCRPGQVICVQGPDGQQVEVTVPMGAGPGQPMWVQVQPQASANGAASSNPEEEADSMVRVLEQDAHSACEFAQQRLLDEMQMQMALWASAEACTSEGAESDQLQVAASQPELSQTQAILLAAAEEGNAAQLLAALTEAKKFSVVSISLEEAAKGLREAEEAMLTWRCLRKALKEHDRHDLEVWIEHAASLGLDVPAVVEQVLEALRGREEELLQSLEKRRDVEQRLEFAEECGDAELLAQVRREAELLGVDFTRGTVGALALGDWEDETLLHASLCDSTAFGDLPAEALSWWGLGAKIRRSASKLRMSEAPVPSVAALRGLRGRSPKKKLRSFATLLGEELPLFVSLRPGAQGFLSWLKSNEDIEIAVYTAGTQAYAEQSVAKLGLQGFPALFRDECVPFGLPITKDLTKLGRDLSRVVLVDNSRRSFWLQPENGLLVSDWTGRNPDDKELERVRRELGELLALEDVRPTLSQRSEPSGTLPVLVVLALAVCPALVDHSLKKMRSTN
ncbi:ctdspl2 [Symbiodinium natans]|uniref:Mitochondrial import inner membrane translocase subunit TIM50 n=1 Tax=Symbiodinium natans TaxID=878477 RepID=A0A812I8Z9_9DINO|nr:ctdspl2 [Symbiodinium natans]